MLIKRNDKLFLVQGGSNGHDIYINGFAALDDDQFWHMENIRVSVCKESLYTGPIIDTLDGDIKEQVIEFMI